MNNYLPTPKIIDDINRVRARIAGTDRDDHLQEIDDWEAKAKESLLKLSISDNEGIRMLIGEAKEQLQAAMESLLTKPKAFDTEYVLKQQSLYALQDMWLWFLNFFESAEAVKKEVERLVKVQLSPKDPETDTEDY